MVRGRAEPDPQPVTGLVDRDVTRPARQRRAGNRKPPLDVDRDDAASAGVGDEGMAAVGVGCDIPGLDESAQHVPHAGAPNDRDGADRRVADDGDVPDAFDGTRIRQSRQRGDHLKRPQVDDGQARFGVAGDERLERRSGERRAQAEWCPGRQGDEFAPVHDCTTARLPVPVPPLRFPRR